jgi:hypothetical protein
MTVAAYDIQVVSRGIIDMIQDDHFINRKPLMLDEMQNLGGKILNIDCTQKVAKRIMLTLRLDGSAHGKV